MEVKWCQKAKVGTKNPVDVFSVHCTVSLPHPNYCAFVTFVSILDYKQIINLDELVSPSVALLAELVLMSVETF